MSEIITIENRKDHDYNYENKLYREVIKMQRCGVVSYKLGTHEILLMNDMAKYIYDINPDENLTDEAIIRSLAKVEYDDRQTTLARLHRLSRPGDRESFTMWVKHDDGSRVHVWVTTHILKMDNGDSIVVSSLLDISALTQLQSLNERLAEEHEYKDVVTSAFNRNGLIHETESLLARVEDRTEYAILSFDIKNFKAVNELFGREGGDDLLRFTYRSICESSLCPIAVARIQADHMACLVRKKNISFDRLVKRLNTIWEFKGRKLHVYCTCGIYYIDNDKKVSVSNMIDRAKLAAHHIVDLYVKPYQIYDISMSEKYIDKAELLNNFEESIANKEFKVFYQPVVEAKSGKIVSAEALVRWVSPSRGFISPDLFIPTLEKHGHISKLDRYVMDTVFHTMSERKRNGKVTVPVSVNLSWMDFYDEELIKWILDSLKSSDLEGCDARFEVTETSYAALEQNRTNIIDALRQCQALTMLDDFGSGYSSFGMLKSYNFDILKIDMTFIKQIEENEKVRYIIQAIVDMCHDIGIKVVAEGAENGMQVDFLQEIGCDYIQGYYFSKPLSEEAFMLKLEEYQNKGMIEVH